MTLTSLMAQTVKCLSTMWETWVQSLGQEDPLEKVTAIHSSTIAWKIPWTEEPGRRQSMGLQRVRHDWATSLHNDFKLIVSLYKPFEVDLQKYEKMDSSALSGWEIRTHLSQRAILSRNNNQLQLPNQCVSKVPGEYRQCLMHWRTSSLIPMAQSVLAAITKYHRWGSHKQQIYFS